MPATITFLIVAVSTAIIWRRFLNDYRDYPRHQQLMPVPLAYAVMEVHTFTSGTLLLATEVWSGQPKVVKIAQAQNAIEVITSIWTFPAAYIPEGLPWCFGALGILYGSLIAGACAGLWATLANRPRNFEAANSH